MNEDFFKVWSHEMAWVLGLFVTDGTISKSVHSIIFAQKDERILKLVAKYMEADYVITSTYKTKSIPTLVINSREIKKDLKLMGITNNKSLTLPFPLVPKEFLPSFIRGIIDGDGTVDKQGYSVNITTGSEPFAKGLLELFQSWELNARIRNVITKNQTTIYRVVISGKKDLIKLSEIVYENVSSDNNFVFYKRVYLTQHSKNPYIINDTRSCKAWKIENSSIVHVSNGRKNLKTYISKSLIDILKVESKVRNTKVNYLVEPLLFQIIESGVKVKLRNAKRNDRIEFRTTFDENLLSKMKEYGKLNNINLNTIIEYAMELSLKGIE